MKMCPLSLFTSTGRKRSLFAALATCLLAGSAVNAQQPTPIEPPPGAPDPNPVQTKVEGLVEEIIEQEVELEVTLRRSKILRMKQPIFRAAIADPSVIEIVAFGSKEIEVIGKDTGNTTMTLWMGNENNAQVLSVLVRVEKDTGVDVRRRMEYRELQQMINEQFPNSRITLTPIADKLIVRGQARDEQEAAQIMSMLRKNGGAGPSFGNGGFGGPLGLANAATAAEPFPDAGDLPESSVISLLRTPGAKQIMLKVRIAELKRSAIRQLGTQFDFEISDLTIASALAASSNVMATGTFDRDSFNLAINALSNHGTAKILAEPNLVVISGQTANFISGGQFPVPTIVGVGGAQAATTQFKGFGTQLTFTPTVLDKDRVRLSVSPSFSTVNSANSVNNIFGLDVRSVNTTVEMREGQTLAIAGLLQEQAAAEKQKVPLFGDIKFLKPLFENKSASKDETELLILVSPELVHPLDPCDAPTLLPGMEVTEPDDVDFFIYGDVEGRRGFQHRSTIFQQFRDRNCRCKKDFEAIRRSQSYFVQGPHGFSY